MERSFLRAADGGRGLSESRSRVRILGILNVTRDSFSDGGKFAEPDAAIAQALQMAADGADVIDVGAESTHPDAEDVTAAEEIARLTPVVRSLKERGLCVSVDTYKPAVMRHVLALGVDFINDVTALRDPEAVAALRDCRRASSSCMRWRRRPGRSVLRMRPAR